MTTDDLVRFLAENPVSEAFDALYDFVDSNPLSLQDDLLLKAAQQADSLDPILTVALLRLSYWQREVLPNWDQALALVRESFSNRGMSLSVLVGL